MVQVAIDRTADQAATRDRIKVLKGFEFGDNAFRYLTQVSAILVLVILGGVIISLILGSLPALQAFGLKINGQIAVAFLT